MSLQVWLPLNGSLENKGLEQNYKIEKKISANSSSTELISKTRSGKITEKSYLWENEGQAISINGYMNKLKTYSTYSIGAWIYYTQPSAHSLAICSSGNWNDPTRKFNFVLYNYSDGGYTHIIIPSLGGWNSDYVALDTPIQPNQWYHICMTCDSVYTKIYINGKLQSNYHICAGNTITTDPENENLFIGGATYWYQMTIKGSINDFRIYDHCLSPREVKYLVQGLVAHYKLTEQITPATEPDTVNLLASAWRYTRFTHAPTGTYRGFINQMGNNSKIEIIQHNGESTTAAALRNVRCLRLTGGSGSNNRCYDVCPIYAGKTYTVSCDFYATHNQPSALHCEMYGGSHNWDGAEVSYTTPNQWKRLSCTVSPQTDTTLFIFFYCASSKYTYINNIQLEEGSSSTSYTPNRRISEVLIGDCSGYGNTGIIPKSLTATMSVAETNPPPKYGRSISFNAINQNFVNCGRGSMVTDEITVSGWFYSEDWSSVTSNSNRLISCAHSGGWDFWPNGEQKMTMEVYRNGSYITGAYPLQLSQWAVGWHYIVGTYDGYQAKIYVDCNEGDVSEVTTTKYPIVYNTDNVLFIGAEAGANSTTPDNMYFTGKISDVRIYATALSEEDIKEIYNTSKISFLDNGTLQCGEIIEDSNINIKFQKDGIVKATKFYDTNSISNLKLLDKEIKATQIYEW